jgi:cell division septation protein DedD
MAQMDGEKELVLGNKQLISLFFVVVALCGVFFAMGYMIGRNTSKVALLTPEAASAAAASPQPQQPEPPREAAPVESAPPADAPQASTLTQAAHDVPVHDEAPEPGGTYLQVTALRRGDADNLVRTLREQKFPALVVESSKSDLFRVLVGPYRQTADVADAKARLKALGFANAFVQK